MRFWDSSAIVPLVCLEPTTPEALEWCANHRQRLANELRSYGARRVGLPMPADPVPTAIAAWPVGRHGGPAAPPFSNEQRAVRHVVVVVVLESVPDVEHQNRRVGRAHRDFGDLGADDLGLGRVATRGRDREQQHTHKCASETHTETPPGSEMDRKTTRPPGRSQGLPDPAGEELRCSFRSRGPSDAVIPSAGFRVSNGALHVKTLGGQPS